MINYDMPWNFMRVEQRIGRIDRIGGQPTRRGHRTTSTRDTVEEQIYRGIAEDFDWFEDVVGPAQPVLSQIESAIEEVALRGPGAEREALLAAKLESIRGQIEQARDRPVDLDDMTTESLPGAPAEPAIDLAMLERTLTVVPATADSLQPHPEIPGAYLLNAGDFEKAPVTIRRDVLDAHSPTVRLLTYGSAELDSLLATAEHAIASGEEADGSVPTPDSVAAFAELLANP